MSAAYPLGGFFIALLSLCVLIIVGVIISLAIEEVRKIISFHQTPTTSIRMLPDAGEVEVVGWAAGTSTTSPLARVPCVFWQIEVEEQRGSRSGWRTVYKRAWPDPFMIDDGTGSVQVLPIGVDLKLGVDLSVSGGLFGNMTAEMADTLERMSVRTTELLGFRRSMYVYERRIVAGEQIYALGTIEQIDGQPLLRSTLAVPLVLSDRSKRRLLLGKSALFGLVILAVLIAVYGLIVGLLVLIGK